ncbi:M48 family metallopeptidase [Rothia kristinae]|nr:M48 family metallopeptidase [Rothia kristinae]
MTDQPDGAARGPEGSGAGSGPGGPGGPGGPTSGGARAGAPGGPTSGGPGGQGGPGGPGGTGPGFPPPGIVRRTYGAPGTTPAAAAFPPQPLPDDLSGGWVPEDARQNPASPFPAPKLFGFQSLLAGPLLGRIRHAAEIPWVVVGVVITVVGWLFAWYVMLVNLVFGRQIAGIMRRGQPGEPLYELIGFAQSLSAQIIALAIVAPIVFFLARALMYAQIRLSGVRITPTQFPEAYRMVVEAAEAAGLRRVPDAYVMLGNGQINAFAAGHGHRRFIAVYSDLFEIGGTARDPEALRFIIGHEVGHIAAGHVSYFRLLGLSLFNQIPVLGNILSRAQEYTADNFGYRFCPQGARGQIKVLAAGKYLNADVNFDEYADRAVYERGLFTWLANLGLTHPANTWRAHALRDRSRPGRLIWRPKQNPPREPLSMVPAAEPAASWADPLQAGRFTDAYHPAPENQHWGINATHRWVPVERRDAPVPDLLDTLWVAPGVRRSPVPPQGPAGAGSSDGDPEADGPEASGPRR